MFRRCVVCLLSFTLLISPALLVAALPAAPPPVDGGWPRVYATAAGDQITLYQPQVASWEDQKWIVMYAAVSYLRKGDTKPALGTLRIEAGTSVAVPERLVNFSELAITSANFPALSRDQVATIASEVNASVPREERVIGLDRVLAAIDTSDVKPRNRAGVSADPPVIFYSTKPAVLVNLDGDPVWSPIKDNDVRFAVNTNWDLFEHPASNTFYLRLNSGWAKASKIDGPWATAGKLPDGVNKLPNDDNWNDVRAPLAGRTTPPPPPAPYVFVSTKPAELLLTHGAPAYTLVPGTKLLWVNNTESDVFRAGRDGAIYYLVSGRWFSAPSFAGPWTFATPNLPDDFKRIPLEHPRSRVLASVPGTTQALEAVLLAQIPQTARVSRADVKAPTVVYSGDPRFQPIEQVGVARAVNTDKDVLKVGDEYYLCYDGVWFASIRPNGPWVLEDSVPDAIYRIPPSSPSYNVTSVAVVSSDDDAVVYEADTGYAGMMVAWGCAVWGSGQDYPPYVGLGGYYPVYYPRYPSYGYGAWYNPWSGSYTRGGAAYGPYGGAGYGARYNPSTGTYSRAAAAWGPASPRGALDAWNPRTGVTAKRQGANIYGSWGSTAVERGDRWAYAARGTNRATSATTPVAQARSGGSAVFAGHDGNVYRRQDGAWQKYENGSWSPVERATGTAGTLGVRGSQARLSDTVNQLNRDFASRRDGAQRTSDLASIRSGTPFGGRAAATYRPGSGSRE